MRAVARHSPELAQAVVACGALEPLVVCLEEFDPGVKEGAAWALGYISAHNPELAQQVIDASAIPLLVLCVQVCTRAYLLVQIVDVCFRMQNNVHLTVHAVYLMLYFANTKQLWQQVHVMAMAQHTFAMLWQLVSTSVLTESCTK